MRKQGQQEPPENVTVRCDGVHDDAVRVPQNDTCTDHRLSGIMARALLNFAVIPTLPAGLATVLSWSAFAGLGRSALVAAIACSMLIGLWHMRLKQQRDVAIVTIGRQVDRITGNDLSSAPRSCQVDGELHDLNQHLKSFAGCTEASSSALQAAAAKNPGALIAAASQRGQRGTQLSTAVDGMRGEITEATTRFTNLIAQIATSTCEPSHGIQQVTHNVSELQAAAMHSSRH